MPNDGIKLAEQMGVELNNLQKAWSNFQLKKKINSPGVTLASTKMLLTPNEKDYLIYLGLESISKELNSILEKKQ